MTNRLMLLAALLLICAGTAKADGTDPIETRQAGQDLFAATYAGIRFVVTAKGDVKTLERPARAMARWMKQFPTQFPKGSEEGHNTKALPAVWSDSEGFLKTANEMVDATTRLAELAKAGDADAVAAQVKAVGEVCDACHREYRAR
ncbi:MAG TPA: cytochrome c [Acetobacteraceae bacterium]|jgi:cytochrome c556